MDPGRYSNTSFYQDDGQCRNGDSGDVEVIYRANSGLESGRELAGLGIPSSLLLKFCSWYSSAALSS